MLVATPSNILIKKEIVETKILLEKFETVNWVSSTVTNFSDTNYHHNPTIEKGISTTGKTFTFPDAVTGGGYIYIEAFFEGEKPIGKKPNGIFVKCIGQAGIVRVEWTDMEYNPIGKTKVAFGSHLLLHIYTQGLYGQEILIGLKDVNGLDKDLNIANSDFFEREVQTYPAKDFEDKQMSVSSEMVHTEQKNMRVTTLQKVEFEVGIDHIWQYGQIYDAAGSFGDELEIKINVLQKSTGEEIDGTSRDSFKTVLFVSKSKGKDKNKTQETTNMPVIVGQIETIQKPEKTPVDFTFGVFLDGTLNNMYNTEIRQAFENKTGKDATSQKDVKPYNWPNKVFNNQEKYRYSSGSSYENDLSNPAIIFKNYEEDLTNKIFRIYVEGIGSNTAPDEVGNLNTKDYKNDDIPGKALGQGASGIIMRVKKAIKEMMKSLGTIDSSTEVIRNITIDVFGFSRGAAAARHFVHVVTHGPYKPKQSLFRGDNEFVHDLQGNNVDSDIYYNKIMPKYGVLGQMLSDADLLDEAITNVIIRFVGIYDTVPHHGLVQGNDDKDLGLNNLGQAEYIVHMIAADEHRANFSLVDISSVPKVSPESGKKGGLELSFPGVHCDVGGAYEEGKPDHAPRIEAFFNYQKLKELKEELQHQGWFQDEELNIYDNSKKITDSNYKDANSKMRLDGYRLRVSNQYSYIPLHHMAEFCDLKQVPITKESVIKSKNFKANWIQNNVSFLEQLKTKLHQYCFAGGKMITFESAPKEIAFLRNHYLHWNSTYGQEGGDILLQTNYPNKDENDNRKRKIR